MATAPFNFTTGATTLPELNGGTLAYNSCTFGPLFASTLSGKAVQDEAKRTTKWLEYTLEADGYVTLSAGTASISSTMHILSRRLSAHGGKLDYKGRGFDLTINPESTAARASVNLFLPDAVGGTTKRDVAWGPVPELLDFQPLGGGLSAKVKWRCTFRVPATTRLANTTPLLQFSTETVVTYGEDMYSTVSVRGIMEIPLTRPAQGAAFLSQTVDNFRTELDGRVFQGIDFARFRPTKRDFHISRDKRTLEFDLAFEEKPYMDLPEGCTVARGTYNFRPVRSGAGLCNWLCTLRCTYTLRRNWRRRDAWLAFLGLLTLRMTESEQGNLSGLQERQQQNPVVPILVQGAIRGGAAVATLGATLPIDIASDALRLYLRPQQQRVQSTRRAWLIDFSGDEGLYLDSKTVSFSASWRMVTTFSHILLASGLWRKLPESYTNGSNIWASSMNSILRSSSWRENRLDPALDVIVDFGGG